MCQVPKLTVSPAANKADNTLCLPESFITLVVIIIFNTIIIITVAMGWRENWEGQATKGKFQEASHNNPGDFLTYI